MWSEKGPVPCGMITYNERESPETGRLQVTACSFSYLSDYDGPPLDPINLNYQSGKRVFDVSKNLNEGMLHRVFEDALPGNWGRRILAEQNKEINFNSMSSCQMLGHMSKKGRATGALVFFTKQPSDETPLIKLKEVDEARVNSLKVLAGMDAEFSDRAFAAGMALGGARPKTTYHDVTGEIGARGVHYMAKFNGMQDQFNNAKVEHAMHILAARAGIQSTHSQVGRVTSGGKHVADILLVERFDRPRAADHQQQNRLHRLSMLSLTDPREVPSQDVGDYMHMVSVIQKASCQPAADIRELYRRMLFNVGVNGTDDHLKNFEMIWDGEQKGFRLSPAFDMMPVAHSYPQVTTMAGMSNGSLSDDFVTRIADKFGIPQDEARRIRNEVVGALKEWKEVFAEIGCDERDFSWMQASINQSGRRAHALYDFGAKQKDPLADLRESPVVKDDHLELRVMSDSRRMSQPGRTKA